jgi:hypothetical protein
MFMAAGRRLGIFTAAVSAITAALIARADGPIHWEITHAKVAALTTQSFNLIGPQAKLQPSLNRDAASGSTAQPN